MKYFKHDNCVTRTRPSTKLVREATMKPRVMEEELKLKHVFSHFSSMGVKNYASYFTCLKQKKKPRHKVCTANYNILNKISHIRSKEIHNGFSPNHMYVLISAIKCFSKDIKITLAVRIRISNKNAISLML